MAAFEREDRLCATLLKNIRRGLAAILRDNLVGIYLHGSLAFGCFHWQRSDVDFIVVTHHPLERQTKREVLACMLSLQQNAPPKGLEMSVVLAEHCRRFVYPTPFQFHFSAAYLASAKKDVAACCETLQRRDWDLAAHFMVIRQAGRVLYGAPVRKVFGEVPSACYWDSIRKDVEEAAHSSDPVYAILNLCRATAYRRNEKVLSKEEGGQWGLLHLPAVYSGIIAQALDNYTNGKIISINENKYRKFCDYILKSI